MVDILPLSAVATNFTQSYMKIITILRHAKSSWSSSDLNDHDRGLNHRGLRDREIMASVMEKNAIIPEIILCSTAARARKTVSAVAKDEWIAPQNIYFKEKLYLATESALCTEIATVDDSFQHVMVCGHNPGLTEFVNEHTDLSIMNLPTCGLVTAQYEIESWSGIFSAVGTMKYHLWPKLFL